MSKKLVFLAVMAILALSVTACKPGRPKGCPKLYPCTVQIIQGGAPLEDATVTCYPESSELAKWAVTSHSDAEGKVVLMTQTYPGAPLGKYKVTVTKQETDLSQLPPVVTHLVAEEYNSRDTTPASIEVVKGLVEPIIVDVGEQP